MGRADVAPPGRQRTNTKGHPMRSRRAIQRLTALTAAVVLSSASAACAFAQTGAGADAPTQSTLTVTGVGTVQARPDQLQISFAVITEDASVGTALAENSERARRVIQALRDARIPPERIQTQQFNIQPRYAQPPRGQEQETPRIVGYRVQNQVVVRTDDLPRAGELIEAAVDAGANSVSSLSFALSNEREVADKALAEAARDARRKADLLAEAAGVRIARVVSITLEPSWGGPMPVAFRSVAMESSAPHEDQNRRNRQRHQAGDRAVRHRAGVSEVGRVVEVGDGIARIYGLAKAMAGELLEFQTSSGSVMGQVMNLEQDTVGAVIYGDYLKVKEGDLVRSTGRLLEVPVGEALLGRVVDPLGQPIDGGPAHGRPTENRARSTSSRRASPSVSR
jgi:uncharacterized protein YggE